MIKVLLREWINEQELFTALDTFDKVALVKFRLEVLTKIKGLLEFVKSMFDNEAMVSDQHEIKLAVEKSQVSLRLLNYSVDDSLTIREPFVIVFEYYRSSIKASEADVTCNNAT